jgi:hypothetical protein
MADTKISALPAATTPLAGTEVLPIVQGGVTEQVSVANLTAGRSVAVGAVTSQVRTFSLGGSQIIERFGASPHLALRGGTDSTVGYEYRVNVTQTEMSIGTGVIGASQTVGWKYLPNFDYEISSGNLVIGTSGKGISLPGGITWTSGSGSPEGVVTAPVGSLFSRSDGGAGTSLYVKQSGTGNTGWVGK